MAVTPTTIRKLAELDTPTICNVIELFECRPSDRGYKDGRIHCLFPELPPMVGFACTAQFRGDVPAPEGAGRIGLAEQLEEFKKLSGPAVPVFQDVDGPPLSALFGEVSCAVYQAFGANGLVTNGGARDAQQVRGLRFPVFAGSTMCSCGFAHVVQLGLPVRVGGLVVNQNDLLHGDANGVAQVPSEIAAEVADLAAEYLAAEKPMLEYARSTAAKSILGFQESQGEYHAAVTRIKARLSGRSFQPKSSVFAANFRGSP